MNSHSTVRRHLLLILCVGLAFRLALLMVYPVPFGEDGFGRIFFRDRVFLSHWLPLTQVIVYLCGKLSNGIVLVRIVFAFLGAAAACGFFCFLRTWLPERASLWGGLLFSTNSLFVILSLMPYQDVLFLGLLFASLAQFDAMVRYSGKGRGLAGKTSFALFFGLACLTRYESWFLIPFLAVFAVREARPGRPSILQASFVALSLLWAPLLWLGLSRWRWGSFTGFLGQTSDGTFYAWNPHLDIAWIAGYATQHLYWIVIFGSPVMIMAIPGLYRVYRQWREIPPAWHLFGLQVSVTILFLFVVMGKEQDTVFRFVLLPLAGTVALTVAGACELLDARWVQDRRVRILGAGILGGLFLLASLRVARLNGEPEFRDPYLISSLLSQRLSPQDGVLVIGPRDPQLRDAGPLLYQRIVVQSGLSRKQFASLGIRQSEGDSTWLARVHEGEYRFVVLARGYEERRPDTPSLEKRLKARPETVAVFESATTMVLEFEERN